MKFLELTLYNFMPFKGKHRITFPTDSSRNVLLIFGDNMRGKTSLLNAFRWAFYGRALGRHLKEIGLQNIVNVDAAKEGDWSMHVHLRFEAEGHEYDLRREIRLRELVIEPKSPNDFELALALRRDGTVLRADKIEHELNQLIPEQVSRFFLFDGELLQEYELLLIHESEQGRRIKEAIEQVLGVPALVNGRIELRALLKRAQTAQAKEMKHIEGMQALAEQQLKLQAEYQSFEKDLEGLKQKEANTQDQIDRLGDELTATQAVQKYKADLDASEAKQQQLTAREAELRDEKLQILRNAWPDLLQPRVQTRIKHLERERDTFQAKIEQGGALKAQIEDLGSLLGSSVCPTCDQSVSAEQREGLGRKLGTLEGQLVKMTSGIQKLAEVSSEISRLSRIRAIGSGERIRVIEKELHGWNVKLVKVENEIENLKEKVKGHDTAEIARKRAKHDQFLTNLGRLQEGTGKTQEKIEENMRKQNQLAKLMSKNPAARNQRSSVQVGIYSALERIFSDGIDKLRDDLRSKVAALATEAFRHLTTEKTYKVLDINENYGLTIIDRENRPVTERSAGAEQIVALALIDGLNRTARKSGPVVMDTPLSRLDPKHRSNVLSYLPQMADQVILLVHEGEIRKDVDLEPLKDRIGGVYQIERISSSQSRLVKS